MLFLKILILLAHLLSSNFNRHIAYIIYNLKNPRRIVCILSFVCTIASRFCDGASFSGWLRPARVFPTVHRSRSVSGGRRVLSVAIDCGSKLWTGSSRHCAAACSPCCCFVSWLDPAASSSTPISHRASSTLALSLSSSSCPPRSRSRRRSTRFDPPTRMRACHTPGLHRAFDRTRASVVLTLRSACLSSLLLQSESPRREGPHPQCPLGAPEVEGVRSERDRQLDEGDRHADQGEAQGTQTAEVQVPRAGHHWRDERGGRQVRRREPVDNETRA